MGENALTLDVLTRLAGCLRDSVCAAASRSLRQDLAEPSRRRALERCCGAATTACLTEAGLPLSPLFSRADLCEDLGREVVFLLRGGRLERAELLELAREAVADPAAELAGACRAFASVIVGMARYEGLQSLEPEGLSALFLDQDSRETIAHLLKGVDTATLLAEQEEVVRGIRSLLEILDVRRDAEPPCDRAAAPPKRSWSEVVADVRARFPEYDGVLRLPERPPILAPTDLDLPSTYFTGRQTLCDGIYDALAAGEWRGIFVLYGLAGIGKSEVARRIVWRLHSEGRFPDGYLWLDFENLDARDVWTQLATRLHIGYLAKVDRQEDQLEILRTVLQAIRPLVILDGANAGQSLDRAFQALRGQALLITSHRPQTGLPAHQFEVVGLEPESGVELFLNVFRSKVVDPAAIPAEGRETLWTISERLAGHPLCLDILASVAARCGRGYEDILHALDRRGIQMIALPDGDASDKAERHRAINKTFDLALDQDLSYSGLPRSLVRTLLSACGVVAGEYFYFEELRSVLQTYLRLFLHEIDQERERAKTSKGSSHIMRFLKLETEASAPDLPPVPQTNAQGVPEVLRLLTNSAELEQIQDALVAASILRVGRVPGDTRVRYRLHPLLREYALSRLPEYLTTNIWKAVAEWNAFKARHIAGDPGEQLPNLLFFLSVCRRRSLHQEYGTILLSLVPYLQRQGMWTRERELLEEAQRWFEKGNDPEGFLAPVNQHLGDLQQRLGDTRSARTTLIAARESFDRAGNLTMCCWIDYWLAGLEEDQRTSEQVRRRLNNLRKAVCLDLAEVAAAELRAVLDALDPHLFSDLHASSNEFLLTSRPLNPSHSNFALKGELLARARAAFTLCDFASAGELLSWIASIQALTYDVETQSLLLRQQALLEIEAGDLAAARERQQLYWDIEGQLGRQRQSRKDNAFIEGMIELAGGRLEAAQAAFAVAKNHDLWLLCDLLLRPRGTLGCTEAFEWIEEKLANTSSLAQIAFLNGLIAAHRVRLGDQSFQRRFTEAFAFLRKRQYIDGRLLVRLAATEASEGPVDCPAEEAFVCLAAARAPFPFHLPTRLRSKEGREMLLVPAGASAASNSSDLRWVGTFYLDQQPVTFGEFKAFLAASGSEPPASWGGAMPSAELDRLPVRGVSYQAAVRYADWAGKVLPTVHELRRAARLAASPEPSPAPDALVRRAIQWVTESFKVLEQPSAAISVELLLDGLGPELQEGDSPYHKRLPWNAGLPHPADAAAFIFGAAAPPRLSATEREKIEEFLHLLSGSLWMDDREKLQILDSVREYGLAELDYVLPDLYEEEIWLLALRPKPDTRLDRLIRFRRQQWRSLTQRRSGVEPDFRLHAEDEACRHFQPHDLTPPFTAALPAGFDLEAHLDPALSPRERRAALDFLSHLATTSLLTKEQKLALVSGLANGIDDIDGDLGKHMFLEREQMTRARSFLARLVVHLDQKWQEWREIAATLPVVCQGADLFRNKTSILAGIRETANPYQTIVHWNDFEGLGVEIDRILPNDFNRLIDCDRFLTLLSNSISLDVDEKLKILDAMPHLTELQVEGLMDILVEERGKFGEFDRMHWPQLEQLFELSRREWHEGVNRLAVEDANPFSALEPWDGLIDQLLSLHDLYPFIEMEDERRLLTEKILHYLFMSIQLTVDDKERVLSDLPRRSREQLVDLLDVLRAEIERYREFSRSRWHVLYLWREKCNAEWIELLLRRTSPQPEGQTPPDQGTWHAHLESPPAAHEILGISARELDGDHFLELMQASVSLDLGVKSRLLRGLHLLSPGDRAELTAILEIERRYFEELGEQRPSCLTTLANRASEQWPQVIASALEQGESEVLTFADVANAADHTYHDEPAALPDGPESPFADQPPCDHGLPESLDLRDLLPPHPDVDLPTRRFLQLLSASLSRSRAEKEEILVALPTLTQGKIDQLLDDLEEERRRLLACPQEEWLELRYECERNWSEWRKLVTSASPRLFRARYLRIPGARALIRQRKRPYDENLSGLDFTAGLDAELAARGNPFAGPHPCDAELPPDLDVRDLLPQHPETLFAEREFLQLLAGSISLTGEEKSRIIDAVPRLTQFQIDELARILLEERLKFNEIGEEHLPQLRYLATLHWIEWVDVAYRRQPSLGYLSRIPTPVGEGGEGFRELDGKLWHWTSSRSKDSSMIIAAGHSAYLPYTDPAMSTPFDFLRSNLEAGSERLTCGFRCCLPIFSADDLKNLDVEGNAGATPPPRSAP